MQTAMHPWHPDATFQTTELLLQGVKDFVEAARSLVSGGPAASHISAAAWHGNGQFNMTFSEFHDIAARFFVTFCNRFPALAALVWQAMIWRLNTREDGVTSLPRCALNSLNTAPRSSRPEPAAAAPSRRDFLAAPSALRTGSYFPHPRPWRTLFTLNSI